MTTAFFIILGLSTGPLLVLLALLMSGHRPEPKPFCKVSTAGGPNDRPERPGIAGLAVDKTTASI